MQKIKIRTANAADFDQVGIIFTEDNQFHADLVPEIIQVAEPIMTHAWYDEVLNNTHKELFVAELSGDLVGVLLVEIRHNINDDIFKPRRYLYINEIAVAAAYRGQGIGRLLMESIQRWAGEQDIFDIELHVWDRNEQAIGFYKKLGYQNWRRTMRLVVEK